MNTKKFNIFSTNDLKKIEQLIWDFLQQGVKNKKSLFHYPTIATRSENSFNLRTVILRNVISKERIIVFHTDYRSNKVKELKNNNKISLHIYDHKNKIQIQSEGRAKIFNKEKLNELVWNSLSKYTRKAYLLKKAPGKKIKNIRDLEYLNNQDGFKNFTIVKVKINKIIFLKLDIDFNKKALIKYGIKNTNYHWLAP